MKKLEVFLCLVLCLILALGVAQPLFSSTKPRQCKFIEEPAHERLLKPTNYLSYLFLSNFLLGEDVDPFLLEKYFQITLGHSERDQGDNRHSIEQEEAIQIGIICLFGDCPKRLMEFIRAYMNPSNNLLDQRLQRKVVIRVLADFSQNDNFPSKPLVSEKAKISVENIFIYTVKFQSKVRFGNLMRRRKGMESFMQKYKESFFLPDSFLQDPFTFTDFIENEKINDPESVYVVWDGNFFSPKLVIPGHKNYIGFLYAMDDATDDWHFEKFGELAIRRYKETFRFINTIDSFDEFYALVSSSFIFKILYENQGENFTVVKIGKKTSMQAGLSSMQAGLSPEVLESIMKKSAFLFSTNTYSLYSSKNLNEKVFTLGETRIAFHNEHWSRFNQFHEALSKTNQKPQDSLGSHPLQDVIMACGVGISLASESSLAFFKTLREADKLSEIVVFVDAESIESLREFSAALKIRLESFWSYASWIPGQILRIPYNNVIRFRAYHEFLKENPQYGRVFLTDLTDVIFQSNLFSILPEFNQFSSPFLYLNNLEGIMNHNAREELADRFKKANDSIPTKRSMYAIIGRIGMIGGSSAPRICAGTIAGDRNTIQLLSLFLVEYFELTFVQGGYDQSVLNYWAAKWPHVFPFSRIPNGHSFFRVEPYPLLSSHVPNCDRMEINRERNQLCLDGDCAPVIHQYDMIGDAQNITSHCKGTWNNYTKSRGIDGLLPRYA